uniref:Uncharacterized protein n=1 Tax=Anguilla anguilla TaxID=7936 RepID=A0A0E9TMH7_ANGAN
MRSSQLYLQMYWRRN